MSEYADPGQPVLLSESLLILRSHPHRPEYRLLSGSTVAVTAGTLTSWALGGDKLRRYCELMKPQQPSPLLDQS